MRPPLTFGNYKPEMKYYFRFDPDSGEVLEFSIEKKRDRQGRLKQIIINID